MASPPSFSTCLTLPPEILRLVLRSFSSSPDDLIFLWTDCRHVSLHFKREVEELFLSTHLRRILIDFHMTSRYYRAETSGTPVLVGAESSDGLSETLNFEVYASRLII